MDTVAGKTLVVGVDPGRSNLSAAVFVFKGKMHKSRYTRSQFYHEANILNHNKLIDNWDNQMKADFSNLVEMGGEIKTNDVNKLLTYLSWNAKIEDKWFGLRFRRKYKRAAFGQYMLKRKTLDKYTSTLKKEIQTLAPEHKIEVAYGSSGPKMRPGGKGELNVPTTGIFKSFKRTFGKDNVVVTNEYNTTKMSWYTGEEKEKVYCKPVLVNDKLELHLHHTNSKYLPKVRQDEMKAFEMDQERRFKDKQRRKGATAEGEPPVWEEPRHTEVRGLRFCKKTRKFTDRDYAAARAIAGLRQLELLGKGRPTAFSTKQQVDSKATAATTTKTKTKTKIHTRSEDVTEPRDSEPCGRGTSE